jgi:hypothetical protein
MAPTNLPTKQTETNAPKYYQLSSHSSLLLPVDAGAVLSPCSAPAEAGVELASEEVVGPFRRAAVPTTSDR